MLLQSFLTKNATMKNSKFLLALFLACIAQIGSSQELEMDEIKPSTTTGLVKSHVYESEEPMSAGTQNALVVVLEVTSTKLAEKVWKDFVKDYGGKTKKVKGDENLSSGVEIVGINGVTPISLYSRAATNADGNVELIAWFNLGDEYLSSSRKAQYNEAESVLLKFAHAAKVESTQEEMEAAEKKLKSFENEMDKLKRQNSGYHKDIEEAEKKIEVAKENIVKNEEQQADATQKIDLQKQLVEEIKRRLSELKNK